MPNTESAAMLGAPGAVRVDASGCLRPASNGTLRRPQSFARDVCAGLERLLWTHLRVVSARLSSHGDRAVAMVTLLRGLGAAGGYRSGTAVANRASDAILRAVLAANGSDER